MVIKRIIEIIKILIAIIIIIVIIISNIYKIYENDIKLEIEKCNMVCVSKS